MPHGRRTGTAPAYDLRGVKTKRPSGAPGPGGQASSGELHDIGKHPSEVEGPGDGGSAATWLPSPGHPDEERAAEQPPARHHPETGRPLADELHELHQHHPYRGNPGPPEKVRPINGFSPGNTRPRISVASGPKPGRNQPPGRGGRKRPWKGRRTRPSIGRTLDTREGAKGPQHAPERRERGIGPGGGIPQARRQERRAAAAANRRTGAETKRASGARRAIRHARHRASETENACA